MAALRFEVGSERQRTPITRLGHREISGAFHTWRTFVYVEVLRDGTTNVKVVRDGHDVGNIELGPENPANA